MSDLPTVTPPAHVRTVTHEELARDLTELREWRAEDYTTLRRIEARMEAQHLAVLEHLGEFARMLGKR